MRPALALIAAVLLIAGCGGSTSSTPTPTPSSPATQTSPFVGYWQGRSKGFGVPYLFQIVRNGSAYAVAANNWTPWSVPMENGRLVLHRYGKWAPAWARGYMLDSYGLELAWRKGRVIALIMSPKGVFAQTTLARTSAASYERQNRQWADVRQPMNSLVLYAAVQKWRQQHGGEPPAASEMNSTSAFAKWMATLPNFETPWPTNLYTGTPMKQGTQPGDFTYTTDGSAFKVVGHLSGGRSYVAP